MPQNSSKIHLTSNSSQRCWRLCSISFLLVWHMKDLWSKCFVWLSVYFGTPFLKKTAEIYPIAFITETGFAFGCLFRTLCQSLNLYTVFLRITPISLSNLRLSFYPLISRDAKAVDVSATSTASALPRFRVSALPRFRFHKSVTFLAAIPPTNAEVAGLAFASASASLLKSPGLHG